MTDQSSSDSPTSADIGEPALPALVEVDEILLTRLAALPGVGLVPTLPYTDHEAYASGPWHLRSSNMEAAGSRTGALVLAVVWTRSLLVPRELLAEPLTEPAPAGAELAAPAPLIGVQPLQAAPVEASPAPRPAPSVAPVGAPPVDNVRPFGSLGGYRVMERGAPMPVSAAAVRPEQAAKPAPPPPSMVGVNSPGPEVVVRPYDGPPLSPFMALDGSIVSGDPYGAGVVPVPLSPAAAPSVPAQPSGSDVLPTASSYAPSVGGLRRAPQVG